MNSEKKINFGNSEKKKYFVGNVPKNGFDVNL